LHTLGAGLIARWPARPELFSVESQEKNSAWSKP